MAKVTTTDTTDQDQDLGQDQGPPPEGDPQAERNNKPLEDLTKAELQDVARERSVPVPSDATKDEMIRSLRGHGAREDVQPPPAAPSAAPEPGKGKLLPVDSAAARRSLSAEGVSVSEVQATKAKLDLQEKETIYIPQSASKPKPPITVQINDYTYQIPRGAPIAVPREVARIAREAGYLDLP